VERIEGLEQEHRDLQAGFRTHYAEKAPKKLEEEQSRFFEKLKAQERYAEEVTPAMPNGPDLNKPRNVVTGRRKLVS
jgi:hypothetical protein